MIPFILCPEQANSEREKADWWLLGVGGERREWEGIFFFQNMGNNIYYIYTVHIQLATGLGDCLVRVRRHVSDLMVKHDLIY